MEPRAQTRQHLRDLGPAELESFVLEHDVPPYRFRQIRKWMYEKLSDDFSEMTDLPLEFRERLEAAAFIRSHRHIDDQLSGVDGTRKFLFELADGNLVESVLMNQDGRITFCVSSQVGCPLDCVFCQTGKGKFQRNLTAGEILDQVCDLKRACGDETHKVNIVFMGMGEPLLNFDSIVRTIQVLNDPNSFDMGSRRITVSTAGLPRRMRDLANAGLRCSLALSLNASSDAQRERLMPAVARYPIAEILDAARYFRSKTGRRVTLEYVMLSGINTSVADARRLGKLAGPFKVNLIPYNQGRDDEFVPPTEEEVDRFIQTLLPYSPTVTVRRSKGPDIDAACGQLWTKSLAAKKKPAKGT